jgi:hypothetical protein|tara:strand:+ start:160 stop:564 length:405 start_codon:yes stop_codon:yes gene_type:complete
MKTTFPHSRGDSNKTVDTANMVRLSKTYESNGHEVVLFASTRCSEHLVNVATPLFFAQPHGQRESVSCHRSGMVVSSTDIHCCNAPVRRRAVFLLVWDKNDGGSWETWHVGSCDSIRQGKRLIDRILETGELPE